MSPTLPIRRLEGIEKLAAIGNSFYQGCYNLIAMLETEGPFSEQLIQCSIEHLQQQFECLQVEVVQDHNQEWVFKHIDEKAKLQVIHSTREDQHLEIWNQLTSKRLDGLAWRIVWVHQEGNDKSYLFGIFHHAIFDGTSMAYFFDSLLKISHDLLEGRTLTNSMRQPIAPPVHQFIRARWPLIEIAKLGYYRYLKKLHTIPFDPQGEAIANRRWHSIFKTLESDELENLLLRCRQQSVKLGNAFSAGIIQEVAERIRQSNETVNLSLCTTVDLRRYNKQIQSTPIMGALLAGFFSYFSPDKDDSIWDLAKKVEKQFRHAMFWRKDRNSSLIQKLITPQFTAAQIHKNQGRPPEGHLVVTNMGRHTKFEHGPFRVTKIHSTSAQAIWGCTFLLGFITVNNRLCISLSYPNPSVADATADSILTGIIRRLFAS